MWFGERVRVDYRVFMQKKPIEPEPDDPDSWAEDQKNRDYYYDDAHGYEEYDPEGEEEDDREKEAEVNGEC